MRGLSAWYLSRIMEGKPWVDQFRRKTQRARVGILNGGSKQSNGEKFGLCG